MTEQDICEQAYKNGYEARKAEILRDKLEKEYLKESIRSDIEKLIEENEKLQAKNAELKERIKENDYYGDVKLKRLMGEK